MTSTNEQPEAVEQDEGTPVYTLDEPPVGKVNWVKWALLHGSTEEELKARPDMNSRTVDICAHELERGGYRTRERRKVRMIGGGEND